MEKRREGDGKRRGGQGGKEREKRKKWREGEGNRCLKIRITKLLSFKYCRTSGMTGLDLCIIRGSNAQYIYTVS